MARPPQPCYLHAVDDRQTRTLDDVKPGGWFVRARSRTGSQETRGTLAQAVARWHVMLCAIAALNTVLWLLSAVAFHRSPVLSSAVHAAGSAQLLLSAAYVFGCAFRSVLPVYDIPRVVLVDSWLSSVAVGRSVATVAELGFAAQWAAMLHQMAALNQGAFVHAASLIVVPLIVLAELFSWYAVLTTEQFGHVVENSLWGVSATLVVAALLVVGPHQFPALYWPVVAWCIGGVIFIAYIFLSDVPMYWSRWMNDRTRAHRDLKLAQGLKDVCQRRVVSYRWDVWKSEVVWMTLYFTFGVWSSVSLVYASLALGAPG